MDPIEHKLHTSIVLLFSIAMIFIIASAMNFEFTTTYIMENMYLLINHIVILFVAFYMKPYVRNILNV
jgi:hypothetical protein